VRELFAAAYGTEPFLVEGTALSDSDRFDASVTLGKLDAKDGDALFHFSRHCALSFDATVTRERREAAAVVLDKSAKIAPSTGVESMELAEFVREVQLRSNRPVVDETGLRGGYDLKFDWQGVTPETLSSELRRQLGLNATVESRQFEFPIVSKK
jgi:uncharacterized protein (TIGR03435 family)